MSRLAMIAVLMVMGCDRDRAPVTTPLSADPVSTEELEPRIPLSGYVLVRAGSPLYSAPALDKSISPIPETDVGPRGATTFKFISEEDEWVQIESLPFWREPKIDFCQSTAEPGLDSAQLKFFVRRDALHPVLTKAINTSNEDGTRIELQPGVAVAASRDSGNADAYWVQVDGFSFSLQIEKSKVGFSFTPGSPFPSKAGERTHEIAVEVLTDGQLKVGTSGSVKSYFEHVTSIDVVALDERDGEQLVEISRGCVHLIARVPSTKITMSPPGDGLVRGFVIDDEQAAEPGILNAASGAPVYWRGGKLAGKLVRAVKFAHEVQQDEERRCFLQPRKKEWTKTGHWKALSTLELCFDSNSLTAEME